jgi:hypothetical protein
VALLTKIAYQDYQRIPVILISRFIEHLALIADVEQHLALICGHRPSASANMGGLDRMESRASRKGVDTKVCAAAFGVIGIVCLRTSLGDLP